MHTAHTAWLSCFQRRSRQSSTFTVLGYCILPLFSWALLSWPPSRCLSLLFIYLFKSPKKKKKNPQSRRWRREENRLVIFRVLLCVHFPSLQNIDLAWTLRHPFACVYADLKYRLRKLLSERWMSSMRPVERGKESEKWKERGKKTSRQRELLCGTFDGDCYWVVTNIR